MRVPESRFQPASRRQSYRGVTFVVIIAVIAGLAAGTVFFFLRSRTPILPVVDSEKTQDLVQLWQAGEYELLLEDASQRLEESPLDETALALRGFAQFYLAMQENKEVQRQEYLLGSVQDLRRVLLIPNPNLEAQVHYILGKAFFHRGRYYYDLSIEELRIALSAGVEQLDLYEYLALASRDLNQTEDAIAYFEQAIRYQDEAIHKITLADILIEEQRFVEADSLLENALATTRDVGIVQHGLISLGQSLRAQERWEEAVAVYERLSQHNPSSAEAHYGLGETYLAMGENNLARFEWREAVRLDPNHIESLQRLQEY